MATLSYCLPEIFDIIVEHLVIAIGIQKAVLLRTVSRAFDAAIMHAICTRQVIDAEAGDSLMLYRMDRNFRVGILLQKSRLATATSQSYLQAIARVNRAMDRLVDDMDPEQAQIRHEAVAKSILFADTYRPITDENELQNLLCAAALTGSIPLVKKVQLLALPTSADTIFNRRTPYFPIALTLAAGEGHFDLVNYLLDQGARQDTEAMYWRVEDIPDLSYWNSAFDFEHLEALETRRFSALRAAVLYGHTDIVHLLLQPEHRLPTKEVEYLRAIMSAVQAGSLDFILLLFEAIGKQQSDFEGLGNYMMWQAIRGDQAEVVQMLLVNGVDLHYNPNHTWWGYGALHLAASLGRAKLVGLLLE
ncbi:unnamed protein product [Zymoseptoria tritici ST99CH_1A5]|uniref:Uncharacterized protein n=2 Tax=Zymoseptoria tritici TaxID=1047171 RepID=A0A2H1GCB5_ZYMTR|nr:unnamed protein product [Zymoseptoria tritici ST99CH_1E4]SMR52230.1 unnamed protein product [Zymoseptoria tritici ST99CH_3D1]SMY23900.1 unnamed protein product [Zymoseptoria tritici ST99CH_1A5]